MLTVQKFFSLDMKKPATAPPTLSRSVAHLDGFAQFHIKKVPQASKRVSLHKSCFVFLNVMEGKIYGTLRGIIIRLKKDFLDILRIIKALVGVRLEMPPERLKISFQTAHQEQTVTNIFFVGDLLAIKKGGDCFTVLKRTLIADPVD
jgi:hypothetical protein